MLPLAADSGDLLVGITAAMAELQPMNWDCFRLFFSRCNIHGRKHLNAVTDGKGKPFFANRLNW